MSAKVRITNGNNVDAVVTSDQELLVTTSTYPPFIPQKINPLRQYLTVDGTEGGANEMGIDGSVTPTSFFIQASGADDRYITRLSVIVGYGATGKPFQWADGNALTNGFRMYYESPRGQVNVHEAIKSNQDLFRLGDISFLPSDWETRHVNALNDYGYIMTIDFTRLFPSLGLKLNANTKERLVVTVNDNATNADSFNIIAYGFDRFK